MRRKAKTQIQPTIPKLIPNPDYEGSEDQKEEAFAHSFTLEEYYTLMPQECGSKIPPEGAWIMVKRSPPTEWTVPPLSFWYALEEVKAKGNTGLFYHKAKILTPKGDLWLWPNEYVIVKDVSKYFEFPDNHIHINLLGGEGVDPDKLFYIRSRGVPKKEAIKMLIGEVKSQNVAYITTHPAYARVFFYDVQIPHKDRLAFVEEWEGEPVPA